MELFGSSDCIGGAGDDAAGAVIGADVVGSENDAGPEEDHWRGGRDIG